MLVTKIDTSKGWWVGKRGVAGNLRTHVGREMRKQYFGYMCTSLVLEGRDTYKTARDLYTQPRGLQMEGGLTKPLDRVH